MKKFFGIIALCLLPLFLAAIFSCSNANDNSALLAALGGGTTTTTTPTTSEPTTQGGEQQQGGQQTGGQTAQPNFLTDWETMEFLCINDNGKLDTKIDAPWNKDASSTLMPDTVRLDVKKEDGWDVAFNLMNKEGRPDMNYFGLYNKYSGVLRFFYYYNKEVSQSATDFAFEIVLGSDGVKTPAYYGALNYGIPLDADLKTNVNLLGDGGSSKTFHILATPYSGIGRNSMTQGWYAFDINMSAYTGKSFYTDGSAIQIACRANNKTSVTLGTDILGKINGDFSATIDKANLMASSNGPGGYLSDVTGLLGGVYQSSHAQLEAAITGGILGALNQYGLWVSAATNLAAIVSKHIEIGTAENPKDNLSGKLDLKLNATAETKGYLESEVATNVKQFTMEKTAFNPDSNVGKGVWNIDKSPELYFISNRRLGCSTNPIPIIYVLTGTNENTFVSSYSNIRIPYFYDPTSFKVSINKEIFPDAANLKVLSYCGIYENNGNKAQNTAFREAAGLGNLETKDPDYDKIGYNIDGTQQQQGGTHGYEIDLSKENFWICNKTQDAYKEADLKFDGLSYKSYGQKTDVHYYGQELCLEGKEAAFNFIVEPQIFYALFHESGETPPCKLMFRRPEMYVVVIVQFESGGRTLSYSRTYLPKMSEIKYDDAKNIVAGIKTRFSEQTEKIYKDEYIRSLDKKMEFLKE